MSNKPNEYIYDPAREETCQVCGFRSDQKYQKCRPSPKVSGFVCERTRKFYPHVIDEEGKIVWPINT